MSLRFRLNLMITLAMLAVIGAGTLFGVERARRAVLDEVGSSLALAMRLVELGLMQADGGKGLSMEWLGQLAHLEGSRHLRIQVEGMAEPRQALAPAVDAAVEAVPAWFAQAVAPPPRLVEKRLRNVAGQPFRIAVQADPRAEIAEAWGETRDFFCLLAALVISVYGLVHVSLGRAFASVAAILNGLEGIEQGDFSRRLPELASPEFSRIAQAFNYMARALEKARDDNRALARHSLAIQEEERRHIAQELHDELGQSLSAIKAMAASLRQPPAEALLRQAGDAIIATCDHLFGVVRGMMRCLRPALLDELGLSAALEDLVDGWRARCPGIAWEFRSEAGVDACSGNARIHLFRLVQEGVTNAVKHAEAARITIRLQRLDEGIGLEVRDDGRGFDPGQPSLGFGLLGMRERVASLGGGFRIDSRLGAGTAVAATIPCREWAP